MKPQFLSAFIGLLLVLPAAEAAAGNMAELPFQYTVVAAPEWSDLFKRNQGWFGADGAFTIPMSGVEKNSNVDKDTTLFLFSDTFVGEVKDGKPVPGFTMINNSVAYLHGKDPDPQNIRFYYKPDALGKPQALFIPQTATSARAQFFWLGDGFVNPELDGNLYIFGYKVERTGPSAFDFIVPEVSLIVIPKGSQPPFNEQRQISTSLHVKTEQLGEGNFGSGVLVNTRWAGAPMPDGYVYVYGCIGKDKNLVVARVKPKDFENLQSWRYWDGKDWNENKGALKALVNSVSDELSMTPLPDGRFLLVFQVLGLSDKVGLRIAQSPVGPFSDIKEIWTAPEWKEGLWTYNAKAHLNLSKPGELLISYNTIQDDFWNAIKKDAHIYRPRFIRLQYQLK